MNQESQLEKEVKKFDWKEWTPIIGLYFVPKHLTSGGESVYLKGHENINGIYHAIVSGLPIMYAFLSIPDIFNYFCK